MPATIHQKNYYYLALGDSYTIGEMVAFQDNFPNRLVALMKSAGNDFQPPRIIAQTGWTTDELEAGIVAAGQEQPLRSSYDFVTLLIGVNNQYRGRTAENYQPEFEELLKKAIGFAGGKADHVAVLSIPDWGVTPFATDRDRAQIAGEIDAYNKVNRQVAQLYKVHYINITPWTREAATDLSLLAADGLHPSAKEYQRWAESLQQFFKTKL
ncbi:MAG TPA: SGNH/GDSL hydrolase family protein [Chitinophagaceae bacterium]|nr:SGNH/GDSL hydrolase family protein [Chitinophagaceae bacterium]